MSAARKTGMLLASVFALFAFFWQASACYAEHAGVIPCHEQAGDSSVADNDVSEGHCCHAEANASLLGAVIPTTPFAFQEAGYYSRDFGIPEGPVEEIDYPPQLS